MQKTFVLDTNVFLHNPEALFVFEDNHVVIPVAVIEEMDNLKKRQDEIGRNARQTTRILDGLRDQGDLSQGVPLPEGGTVRIEVNHRDLECLPENLDVLDGDKPDNRILALALNLAKEDSNGGIVLVTKDLNLRLKADVLGIQADDLTNDKVEFNNLYPGQGEVCIPQTEMDGFYRDHCIPVPVTSNGDILPNQFVVIRSLDNPSASALARCKGRVLQSLAAHAKGECFGLRPRNKEQIFSLDVLMDPDVKVVTLAGGAGTGKTLLALAAGLEQVMEREVYSKLLVTRPVIPLDGQDLGFLPGDKEDKIRPWMQPIYDNLELLFRGSGAAKGVGQMQKGLFNRGENQPMDAGDYLAFTGQMELEALTYVRGRSIPRQFIIVDEAQNCTAHTIKTMLTRVGEDSKIIFTGDIDQIDHPYLDSASSGFTVLVEKMKKSEITGHVKLVKGERSEVAELGATLM